MLKQTTMIVSVALAMALGTAAFADDPNADTVVASVNGTDITLGEMIVAKSQLPAQYQQLPDDVLFNAIMDQLIQQQLMADTLENEPKRVQIALTNSLRSLRAGEVVDAMLATSLTDEAIQAEFDAQIAAMGQPVEYHAAHILVPTEEEARAVLDRLNAGEDFAALATELSQDPGSAAVGGDLGWFGTGMMVQPFEDAVMALDVGSVSEPVQTQFGWHVIKLSETRDKALPTIEQLRGDIISKLQNDIIGAMIAELTASATITRPEEGAFDPALLSNLGLVAE